jgi:hypothetical protein
MSTGEKYVAAAYAVVLAAVVVYVAIISFKLARFEREITELTELARKRRAAGESEPTRAVREHDEMSPAAAEGTRHG